MAIADKLSALRIKASIIADPAIGLMEIETDVHDGVAVLTGEVETEEQKRVAEELAYQVEGIMEVENEIRVAPPSEAEEPVEQGTGGHLGYGLAEGDIGATAFEIAGARNVPGPGVAASEQFPGLFSDEDIETDVRRKLDQQQNIDVSRVHIDSQNQVVRITGAVRTEDDLNALQDLVLSVRGAMGVAMEAVVDDSGAAQ